MKMIRATLIATGIAVALIAAGCGGGGGDGGDGNGPARTSYLPMQVGNSWTYLMTLAPGIVPLQEQPNQLFDYHETVTGIASLTENDYFLVRSVREGTDEYIERAWQQVRRETEEAIYARVGDPAYDLPVLMLPPRQGETWTDPIFPEVVFTTAAVGEQVTVPAGTFTCVRVERTYERPLQDGGSMIETTKSWFARGVGMVKEETWTDDVHLDMIELVEYTVQ